MNLTESISSPDNGETWDFQCPNTDKSCGDPDTGIGFTSTGWPSPKLAKARGKQHFFEHTDFVKSQELDDFRAEHGLATTEDECPLAGVESRGVLRSAPKDAVKDRN